MDKRTPDEQWAREFVKAKIPGVGQRLGDTVKVLVDKLAEVRAEGKNA